MNRVYGLGAYSRGFLKIGWHNQESSIHSFQTQSSFDHRPSSWPSELDERGLILAQGKNLRVLAVDLDDTLISTDLLFESALSFVAYNPREAVRLPIWLLGGKYKLKSALAERMAVDPVRLPYIAEVVHRVRVARADGRHVVLASASHALLVAPLADHIGFDSWMASDAGIKLSGTAQAARLVGNGEAALAIWSISHEAIAISPPSLVAAALRATHPNAEILSLGAPVSKLTWCARLLDFPSWRSHASNAVSPRRRSEGGGRFF